MWVYALLIGLPLYGLAVAGILLLLKAASDADDRIEHLRDLEGAIRCLANSQACDTEDWEAYKRVREGRTP